MSPDQTAPLGAVWSGFILFAISIGYLRTGKQITKVVTGG